MHKDVIATTWSAPPDGIPLGELTEGMAISLSSIILNLANPSGLIESSSIVNGEDLINSFALISSSMPWGVAALSGLKLCRDLVDLDRDEEEAFPFSAWQEMRCIMENNIPELSLATSIPETRMVKSVQHFTNNSVLPFIVGAEVDSVPNPTNMGISELEYSVTIAIICSALIGGIAKASYNVSPQKLLEGLRSNLIDSLTQ